MSWVLLVIQFTLGAVFLLAATGKAMQSEAFLAALRRSSLPAPGAVAVSIAVPVAEVGVAAALVLQTPQSLQVALAAAAAMLGAFTAWMAWVRARGLVVRCGCFGIGSAVIGRRSILRNLLLLGMALGGLALATRTSSPLPGPSVWMAVLASSLGMVLALLFALRTALPALAWTLDRLQAPGAGARREG